MIKVHKRHIVAAISTTLLVILTTYGLIMLENGYFNDIFKKIGVYPEQEKFTALFFENSGGLTLDSQKDTEIKSFTFGIYNSEGKTINYAYSVDVYDKGEMLPLKNGTLEVSDQETVFQDIVIDLDQYSNGSLVYVTLPLNNKSIDFEIQ